MSQNPEKTSLTLSFNFPPGDYPYSLAEKMAADAGGISPLDLPGGAAEAFASQAAEEFRRLLLCRPSPPGHEEVGPKRCDERTSYGQCKYERGHTGPHCAELFFTEKV